MRSICGDQALRRVAAELGRSICILQDLQGPRFALAASTSGAPVTLRPGRWSPSLRRDVPGTTEVIATTYQDLAHDVKPGERILLSDGRIELVVQRSA